MPVAGKRDAVQRKGAGLCVWGGQPNRRSRHKALFVSQSQFGRILSYENRDWQLQIPARERDQSSHDLPVSCLWWLIIDMQANPQSALFFYIEAFSIVNGEKCPCTRGLWQSLWSPLLCPYRRKARATPPEMGRVLEVLSGDTITVNIAGQAVQVRYIGIEAPDINEVCFHEALQGNQDLVHGRTVVMLRRTGDTDRDGYVLRYVFLGSVFINAELIRLGYAETPDGPPDSLFGDWFNYLEQEASRHNLNCHALGAFGNSFSLQTYVLSPMPQLQTTAVPSELPDVGGSSCPSLSYRCSQFSSCSQAYACLRAGNTRLDSDGDGVPCEAICPGG